MYMHTSCVYTLGGRHRHNTCIIVDLPKLWVCYDCRTQMASVQSTTLQWRATSTAWAFLWPSTPTSISWTSQTTSKCPSSWPKLPLCAMWSSSYLAIFNCTILMVCDLIDREGSYRAFCCRESYSFNFLSHQYILVIFVSIVPMRAAERQPKL